MSRRTAPQLSGSRRQATVNGAAELGVGVLAPAAAGEPARPWRQVCASPSVSAPPSRPPNVEATEPAFAALAAASRRKARRWPPRHAAATGAAHVGASRQLAACANAPVDPAFTPAVPAFTPADPAFTAPCAPPFTPPGLQPPSSSGRTAARAAAARTARETHRSTIQRRISAARACLAASRDRTAACHTWSSETAATAAASVRSRAGIAAAAAASAGSSKPPPAPPAASPPQTTPEPESCWDRGGAAAASDSRTPGHPHTSVRKRCTLRSCWAPGAPPVATRTSGAYTPVASRYALASSCVRARSRACIGHSATRGFCPFKKSSRAASSRATSGGSARASASVSAVNLAAAAPAKLDALPKSR
mmetsp:Transcript_18995/g.62084  ORF Transcript_18995/g.62084 Transcript_18995/m.62084 type:complete len:364 (+) Transcript_18995:757-1848(+)|eukprot:scaffold18987_cov109-Isochrysis_galbana.AAC.13